MPEVAQNRSVGRAVRCPDPVLAIVQEALPGATVARRPFPYGTSHRLEEVEVERPDGRPLVFVAKHLGRGAMTEEARLAKPAALASAGRELAVYEDLLVGAGLDTPVLIGGRTGPHSGVLVLERVDGSPLSEIGDFASWEAAARWLARMHATFVNGPALIPVRARRASLVRYDRRFLGAAGRRGLRCLDERRLRSAADRTDLAAGLERALDALVRAPVTLVHGDFYASNILIAWKRTAVVDWELAGTGPGALDVAALAAGTWGWEHRRALVVAYHEQSGELGPTEPLDDLLLRVALASLHLALCWVGSAAAWKAPREHQQDWVADAVTALAYVDRCSR